MAGLAGVGVASAPGGVCRQGWGPDPTTVAQRWLPWGLMPVVVGSALALHVLPALPPTWVLAGAAALALLVGFILAPRLQHAPRARAVAWLVALGLATWSWSGWVATQHLAARLPAALEGRVLRIVGTIDELPARTAQGGYRFIARVEQCVAPDALAPCHLVRVALSWHGRSSKSRPATPVPVLRAGQRWAWEVRLKRPHAPHNPGAFDRELRSLQEQVGATGTVLQASLLDERAAGLGFERLRTAVRDRMLASAPASASRAAGVLVALAIGDQAAIDPALWGVFNRTGVGHLMSISGLHITMLAAMAGAGAAWLWRRPWAARWGWPCWLPVQSVRLAAAVAVAWAYAMLAGWGIPAQRTCLMLMVAAALLRLGRTASVLAAVGCAAVLIVWLDPWAPLTAGFWLSFGAVLAIVWAAMGQSFALTRARRFWTEAVRTQWAATVSLLPWGAWFFASVSLVGPLANALAIPLVSGLITPLALAGGALALVSVTAAGWVLRPVLWVTEHLLGALEMMSEWPAAAWPLAQPGWPVLALALIGCVLWLAPAGIPGRWWGGLALVPLGWVGPARPLADELWLTALDVGQGTAVVIQVADRVLVYDTGPTGITGLDSGTRVLVPWLRAQGIDRLDAVVISHQDDDHVGGAPALLRAMPPDWLASSLPADHPVRSQVAAHYPCRRGEHWRWGTASFEWLHPADPPEPARGSPSNAVSCVLRIQSPGGTILLTGDIEAPQERRLLEHYGPQALQADVLLVPHHGSKTSSTPEFLDAVAPRWALIQAAYRSRYGHPHPKVLARYLERPITVLRSDAHGAVTLRLSPTAGVHVQRSRLEPERYWRVPVDVSSD